MKTSQPTRYMHADAVIALFPSSLPALVAPDRTCLLIRCCLTTHTLERKRGRERLLAHLWMEGHMDQYTSEGVNGHKVLNQSMAVDATVALLAAAVYFCSPPQMTEIILFICFVYILRHQLLNCQS